MNDDNTNLQEAAECAGCKEYEIAVGVLAILSFIGPIIGILIGLFVGKRLMAK